MCHVYCPLYWWNFIFCIILFVIFFFLNWLNSRIIYMLLLHILRISLNILRIAMYYTFFT